MNTGLTSKRPPVYNRGTSWMVDGSSGFARVCKAARKGPLGTAKGLLLAALHGKIGNRTIPVGWEQSAEKALRDAYIRARGNVHSVHR